MDPATLILATAATGVAVIWQLFQWYPPKSKPSTKHPTSSQDWEYQAMTYWKDPRNVPAGVGDFRWTKLYPDYQGRGKIDAPYVA